MTVCYMAVCYMAVCYMTVCYMTVCYMTVCYMTVCYMAVCYMTVCYMTVCYMTVCYMAVCYMTVCYMTVCYMAVCYMTVCYMAVCYMAVCREDVVSVPVQAADRSGSAFWAYHIFWKGCFRILKFNLSVIYIFFKGTDIILKIFSVDFRRQIVSESFQLLRNPNPGQIDRNCRCYDFI
jgi:hypothetical protein